MDFRRPLRRVEEADRPSADGTSAERRLQAVSRPAKRRADLGILERDRVYIIGNAGY
jgi:hypothetical protein